MDKLTDFYQIVNVLKFAKRQGWLGKGLDTDSIAAHIFGTMSIGWFMAEREKADPHKVVEMLLVHDFVMAKMEDVTPLTGNYEHKTEMEEKAKIEVMDTLPENLKAKYVHLFNEFQEQRTKEALIARESDKIETLLQGETYEEKTGRKDILDGFFETYVKIFRTATGRKIFEEIKSRHEDRK